MGIKEQLVRLRTSRAMSKNLDRRKQLQKVIVSELRPQPSPTRGPNASLRRPRTRTLRMDARISRVLFSEAQIEARVKELADKINEDYKHTRTLVVVCILKGAFMFCSDIVKRLRVPNVVIDFMSLSSYESKTFSTGAVRVIMDLRQDIYQHDVLIVEDIIDSGHTLKYLIGLLAPRQPASLKVAVLLKKTSGHKVPVDCSYIGFECPPAFVVGYGLDAAEFGRHLPFIGAVDEVRLREAAAAEAESMLAKRRRLTTGGGAAPTNAAASS